MRARLIHHNNNGDYPIAENYFEISSSILQTLSNLRKATRTRLEKDILKNTIEHRNYYCLGTMEARWWFRSAHVCVRSLQPKNNDF